MFFSAASRAVGPPTISTQDQHSLTGDAAALTHVGCETIKVFDLCLTLQPRKAQMTRSGTFNKQQTVQTSQSEKAAVLL